MLKRNTLIVFHSMGSTYHGFIIGTCGYDGGDDNAYVVRYVFKDQWEGQPRRPYAIVDLKRAEPVKEYPEDFLVCGYWSATPDDRTEKWDLQKDPETGNLLVMPDMSVAA